MKKYSYCKDLREQYHVDELDSKTLTYRIDGFIDACGMNLEDSVFEKKISVTFAPYVSKTSDVDGMEYNVNFAYHYDCDRGKYFVILGDYNDLSFMLANYYDKDKNYKKVIEIPFSLVVEKTINDFKYRISLESTFNQQVEFIIAKDNETIHFYANIIDFSKVLNLVHSFVIDPEIVFNIYSEIINNKKVVFTNGDLNKAIEYDEKFEKPVNGIVKKLKFVTNNEIKYKKPKNDNK